MTLTSLWRDRQAREAPERGVVEGHWDVLVIGAGITGLTTGLLLARAGKSVAVVEAGRSAPGPPAGAPPRSACSRAPSSRGSRDASPRRRSSSTSARTPRPRRGSTGTARSTGSRCRSGRRTPMRPARPGSALPGTSSPSRGEPACP
ncbi:FAD-dependent oxidoreductase [Nocardioides ungokensis]|uniref:FAD-dependent oxidoreductase n=1 Tax=Nocardioides ungokensis TaxID=1643322 RepID=UPI003CCCE205